MKTKEELNTLKEEIETLNSKLAELSKEELKQVVGGSGIFPIPEQTTADFDPPRYEFSTLMRCNVCKKGVWWVGDFTDGGFDCPECGAKGSLYPEKWGHH